MSIYKNLTMSLIALNLLFSVSQGDVFAQENTSLQIEEIIVTAQKREQSAQDVPIAITAMSEELLSSTIRDISDIIRACSCKVAISDLDLLDQPHPARSIAITR